MADKKKTMETAETMARKQRDISVSEFFLKNRHLLGFDNPRKALLTTVKEAVDNALDAYEEAVPGMADLYERLRGQRVSVNKAKALTVDLASAGAIPSAHILSTVREFSKPSHQVFRHHDAWSLYNAVTEASFKRMSPQRSADGYRILNEVLVSTN